MDENRIVGAAKAFGGKVRGKVGAPTGERSTRAEGALDETEGGAQTLYGRAKDAAVVAFAGRHVERYDALVVAEGVG